MGPPTTNLSAMRPVDGVTLEEAARILGVARSTVQEWLLAGRISTHGTTGQQRRLSQSDVEALALELYDWRRHADSSDSGSSVTRGSCRS